MRPPINMLGPQSYLIVSSLAALAHQIIASSNLVPQVTSWSVQLTTPSALPPKPNPGGLLVGNIQQTHFDDAKEWPLPDEDGGKHQSAKHKFAQNDSFQIGWDSAKVGQLQPAEVHGRPTPMSTSLPGRFQLDKLTSSARSPPYYPNIARHDTVDWNLLNLPLIELGGFRDIIPSATLTMDSLGSNKQSRSRNQQQRDTWMRMRLGGLKGRKSGDSYVNNNTKSRLAAMGLYEPTDSVKARAFTGDMGDMASKEDYAPNLPLLFAESTKQTVDPRASRQIGEEETTDYTFLDNMGLSTKHSPSHQVNPAYYTASYPVIYTTAHEGHKFSKSSRRGLEKSLALPVLVGIGTALISFLLLSNLFLSLPLLAMTLMQLINGNMMPNNQNNNAPNNNQQTPNGQTTNGRRKRDLVELKLEQNVKTALGNFEGHF